MDQRGRFSVFWWGAVLILAIFTYGSAAKEVIIRQAARQSEQARLQERIDLANYLQKQTDPRKLVSLAKHLAKTADQSTVEQVTDRAYELSPQTRDIVILDSYFHPELKNKITELDPLYKFSE